MCSLAYALRHHDRVERADEPPQIVDYQPGGSARSYSESKFGQSGWLRELNLQQRAQHRRFDCSGCSVHCELDLTVFNIP